VCKFNQWLCSEESIESIKKDIESENLNRVVIGACSQRFLSDVFRFDSKVLVDRVNLRENVAWTHKANDEDTQMLAEDYLRMGIAKVNNSEPPEPFNVEINEIVLVVGGGVSGMTSALAAAKSGSQVILTEKENHLGGWLNKFYKVTPGSAPYTDPESSGIEDLISEVKSNEKIKVIQSCLIEKISGQPGDFTVTLKINNEVQSETLKVGAIVQATGWKQYNPNKLGELGYGKFNKVITGIQLEEFIKNGTNNNVLNGKPIKSVTFIQCAGSRDEKHLPYCSSVCCSVSLKQALYIREKYPDALIYIIYKDIRTPAQHELFYKRVQNEDNIFLTKGDVSNLAQSEDGTILIDIDDTLLGEKIQIESEVVVLATGMVPSTLIGEIESDEQITSKETTLDGKKTAESAEVGAKILNLAYRQGTDLPTLKYGFPDSHYICFPYETRRTGIYAAGTVRSPMDITASKNDAYGAALKAIQMLYAAKTGKAVHPRSGDQSYPDFFLQRCTQCKRCTEECPFGTLDEDAKGTPLPNLTRCRRCGICLGACPERIISFKDYSIQMISSMIKAVDIPDEFEEKPRILAFLCENDAYPSLDIVGKYHLQYDPNVRVIPVRCLGSVNVVWIADALSRGFDGILMIGCKYGDDYQCHYIKGSELADKRMENVQEKLKQLVLEPERVKLLTLSIDEYKKLPGIFNDFVEEITDMGFNPYKGM
ncbi:hydrogenase iron-sulfur subunit, partial [bacterium BMS3Abin03]|nr:hydrogenase iron-sulfur subunit [bacterium BMS3Abin03]MCG6961452.1 hydrogenase iron-sulfur subunit [bacterium BMS3Abin03]